MRNEAVAVRLDVCVVSLPRGKVKPDSCQQSCPESGARLCALREPSPLRPRFPIDKEFRLQGSEWSNRPWSTELLTRQTVEHRSSVVDYKALAPNALLVASSQLMMAKKAG